MKFRIKVKDDRNQWWEDYDKPDVNDLPSAEIKGRELVQYFNDTIRPYETPRTFLLAELTSNGNELGDTLPTHESHEWEKSNLVTIRERGRYYDTAKCSKCGITAKRFGLGDHVIDGKYRAKAFKYCDTAQELLAKRSLAGKER
jgi:hypothetical protein